MIWSAAILSPLLDFGMLSSIMKVGHARRQPGVDAEDRETGREVHRLWIGARLGDGADEGGFDQPRTRPSFFELPRR